jgi:hypothetical protein
MESLRFEGDFQLKVDGELRIYPQLTSFLMRIPLGLEEKSIRSTQKDRGEDARLSCYVEAVRIALPSKILPGLTSMKVCPNSKCSRFGHIVYAVTTRCPVCKWDLKPPLQASESPHPGIVQTSPTR